MNIYVGNLDYAVDEEMLTSAFEAFGEVNSVKIISDKYTGRSKGFGFVVMDNDEEAQNAIKELDGSMLKSRPLKVNEARPERDRR